MQNLTHKNPFSLIAFLLGLLVLSSLACSLGSISLSKDAALVDVTLTQDQLNRIFQNIDVRHSRSNDILLDQITSVELHDGFIRVGDTALKPDGSSVNGSYDLSLSAQNDQLNARITGVAIPGVELNDPQIVSANQKLADELTRSVNETNGEVLFKEAVIKEGSLSLKIQINFQNQQLLRSAGNGAK